MPNEKPLAISQIKQKISSTKSLILWVHYKGGRGVIFLLGRRKTLSSDHLTSVIRVMNIRVDFLSRLVPNSTPTVVKNTVLFSQKKCRNKVSISFLGVFLGGQDVAVKATKTSVEEVESESKKFGWGVSKSIILMMTNISKINLASKLFFCQSAPLTMRTMMNHRNHQQNMTLSQKTSTSSRMLTRTKKFSIKLDFFRLVYFFYWNSGCLWGNDMCKQVYHHESLRSRKVTKHHKKEKMCVLITNFS